MCLLCASTVLDASNTLVIQTCPCPQHSLVDDTEGQFLSVAGSALTPTFRGSQAEVWEEGGAHLEGDHPTEAEAVCGVLVARECVGRSLRTTAPVTAVKSQPRSESRSACAHHPAAQVVSSSSVIIQTRTLKPKRGADSLGSEWQRNSNQIL